MSTNPLHASETPNYFDPAKNVGASDIVAQRLVKSSGVNQYGVDIASAAADVPYGVSTETIPVNGTRSVQCRGTALVVAGGAITRGAFITSDASGRAIATVTAGNSVWGKARTAAAALGDVISIDLGLCGSKFS